MKGRVSELSLSQDQLIFRNISFHVPNQDCLAFIWVQVLLFLTSKRRCELKRSKANHSSEMSSSAIQVKCQVQPCEFSFLQTEQLTHRLNDESFSPWTDTPRWRGGEAEPCPDKRPIFLILEVKGIFVTIHAHKGSSKVKMVGEGQGGIL